LLILRAFWVRRESSSVLEVVMEWEWQLEVWGKKESWLWKEEAK
jgi:hypothetical protein